MDVLIRRSQYELNLYGERSRLSAPQLARWQGLPLSWIDAGRRVSARHVVNERPVLALLEAGEAEADFDFPLRSLHLNIAAGAMGLFLPGETRSSRWRCAGARRVLVELDPVQLADRGLDVDEFQSNLLHQNLEFRDTELAALLRAMAHEVALGSPNGRLYAESVSVALLARLHERFGRARPAKRKRGRLTTTQLAQVDEFIERHLAEALPLAALASVVGLSAPHFARLFRNATGSSPHRHVMCKRVQRACELLQHTVLPLPTVALAAGFSSQSHMNGVISTALGTTPGELRRAASPRAAGVHWSRDAPQDHAVRRFRSRARP